MDEANARLAFYLPLPDAVHLPGVELPPRPQLPESVIDAPLIRVFNFLRMSSTQHCRLLTQFYASEMMSLSYQLEILWYQVCYSIFRYSDFTPS